MTPKFARFWIVWCPGARTPACKHTSPLSANTEAERLARLHSGREFYVLEAQSSAISNALTIAIAVDRIPPASAVPEPNAHADAPADVSADEADIPF